MMMGFTRGWRKGDGVRRRISLMEQSERGDSFLPRNDGLRDRMDSGVVGHVEVGVTAYPDTPGESSKVTKTSPGPWLV